MSARGFGSVEMIVGAALSLGTVLAALTLTQGLTRLTTNVQDAESRRLSARWSLDQIVRAIQQAGIGVCPGHDPACSDEPIEFFAPELLVLRGDRDRDDPAAARVPETLISGRVGDVLTGNDELLAFTRRASSRNDTAIFAADLDSADHVPMPDGAPVARRDGVVESIDVGGMQAADDPRDGTLYRVAFVNDARSFGTGRFRISEPLADGVGSLRFEAFDRNDLPVADCGGADDAPARACRASIKRIRVSLTLRQRASRRVTLSADAVLP